jgi:hypothetical protein
MMAEGEAKPFTAEDIRFTVGGGGLNAFFLDTPRGESAIASLGRKAFPRRGRARRTGRRHAGRVPRDGDALG